MLALGVVWYGMGNWEKIRMDPRLKLAYKLNTLNTLPLSRQLPNASQLLARMQLILKTLASPSIGTMKKSIALILLSF